MSVTTDQNRNYLIVRLCECNTHESSFLRMPNYKKCLPTNKLQLEQIPSIPNLATTKYYTILKTQKLAYLDSPSQIIRKHLKHYMQFQIAISEVEFIKPNPLNLSEFFRSNQNYNKHTFNSKSVKTLPTIIQNSHIVLFNKVN